MRGDWLRKFQSLVFHNGTQDLYPVSLNWTDDLVWLHGAHGRACLNTIRMRCPPL